MSTQEEFLADVRAYFDEYPLMSRDPGAEPDGNGILYAGTYGLLYAKLFGEYKNSAEHSTLLYRACYLPEKPGVITRGPHKWLDPQTHDDYIGMCTLSGLNHGDAATAIYMHGKKNWWFYFRGGVLRDKFNAIFYRLPGVVQHIKICAGVQLNQLDMVLLAAGLYSNSLGDQADTSGKIMKWHMASMYLRGSQRNWLCDWAVQKWIDKLMETYPNGMSDVFAIYYGKSHPFVRWAVGIN